MEILPPPPIPVKPESMATQSGSVNRLGYVNTEGNRGTAIMSQQVKPPLDGIRVIDAATFIAAPFASTILSEFGAEVIKIENPKGGDLWRYYGTMTDRGDTLAWLSEARNKTSVTLDLRTPEGVDIFKKLVAVSDVVCENFRPGTLERWGLGWDVLSEINPRLILLRVSGYGQTGPYKDRPGFARIAQAFGGLTYLAGMPDGPPVTPGSTSLADYTTGLYGAVGILVALKSLAETGRGQVIDIGLYESIFRLLDELVPAYAKEGTIRAREGTGTQLACPHGHFPTSDDKWVSIACTSDRMFERLAHVMGQPELAGPDRYQTAALRLADRERVIEIVTAYTQSMPQSAVVDACTEGQVPCGAINSIADIFADPQFAARDNLLKMHDEIAGEVVIPGVIPKLSETPGEVRHLGPPLRDGIEAVYGELLGLSKEEIGALREKGII
jgi:crotonobetainyl-CoA:carnitine CoA-transferase CaiB-like acyl-CoA transferase